jgi:hypothetical protein
MIKAIYNKRVEAQNTNHNPALGDLAFMGENNILGKVIEISENTNVILPLQNIEPLRLSNNVTYLKINNVTTTHPALFGRNWDILNNEISVDKLFVETIKTKLSKEKYDFIPVVQNNSKVLKNQKIGYTQLEDSIKYWIIAPVEGIVQNVTAGTYNLNQKVANIVKDELSFPVFFDARVESEFEVFTINEGYRQLFTRLTGIDLFYPITFGTKNYFSNFDKNSIGILRKNIKVTLIIYLSSLPINDLTASEICFVDYYDDIDSLVEATNSLAYSFAIMGIDVLIVNLVESNKNIVFGEVMNIDGEKGSITLINIDNNSTSGCSNIIEIGSDFCISSSSCIKNSNLQDMIIENSSIAFLADYNNYHKNKKDVEYNTLIKHFLKLEPYDSLANVTNSLNQSIKIVS